MSNACRIIETRRWPMRRILREDQRSIVGSNDFLEHFHHAHRLPGSFRCDRSCFPIDRLEVVSWVIADLLELYKRCQYESSPSDSFGAIHLAEHLLDDRVVEICLFRGPA